MRRILAGLLALALPTAAIAGPSCYLEASTGKNITSTKAETLAGPVTITADGLMGGIGSGCEISLDHWAFGIWGRWDSADVSKEGLSFEGTYSAGGKLGYRLNPGTTVYGLAGYATDHVAMTGFGSTNVHSPLIGAGIEIELPITGMRGFIEWDQIHWQASSSADATLKPSSDLFRVGVRYHFDAGKLPELPKLVP